MMFGTNEPFDYFQCRRCGCLQIVEIPSDLSRHYPDGYYSHQAVQEAGGVRRFLLLLRNRYALHGRGVLGKALYIKHPNTDLYSLRRIAPSLKSRILDVGCGSGRLLLSLRELGFQNLLGIDPFNPADLEYGCGVIVRKMPIAKVEGRWDVVMLHHSFEHLELPGPALKAVANLLADDGWCIVRVPVVSSFAWEQYGVQWVQLDAPRHLFLHSEESMRHLAGQSGLELAHIEYDSTAFQFWGSERYAKGIPLQGNRAVPNDNLFSRSEMKSFKRKARQLNMDGAGDQAIFYLRKAERQESG
jgi:SAM-dependent methyltransferase